MKQNSVRVNLRHLQDSLAAVAAAASAARLDAPPACPPTSSGTSFPPGVLTAAYRALQVGATPREVAAAGLFTKLQMKTVLHLANKNEIHVNLRSV